MARNRFALGFGIVLAVGMGIVACADDEVADGGPDAGPDSSVEAGTRDSGATEGGEDSGTDAGPKDAGTDAKDADADADLPPAPGVVSDLAGVAETHKRIKITWTAPPDYTGKGTVAHYDLRWSATPITTEAEFLAATAVATAPPPEAPGTLQMAILEGLTPETQYYVALRAQYDDDAYGPLSNVVDVSTKARAQLLITEIAPANTAANGGDFVELVATKAGFAGDLEVIVGFMMPLHKLAPLDVQLGDRIVIHASGLPGPTGFAQEDATKNKGSSTAPNASATSYDVYSAVADLPVAVGAVAVTDEGNVLADPTLITDLVLYSDRSISSAQEAEPHQPSTILYAAGDFGGSWPLTVTQDFWADPETADFCQVWVDAVNGSGDAAPACGGAAGTLTDGRSIQRMGTTDTNSAADFTVAAQTRGTAN